MSLRRSPLHSQRTSVSEAGACRCRLRVKISVTLRPLSVCRTRIGVSGGIDPDDYREAELAGRVSEDVPVNHWAVFAPVIQPTRDRRGGVGHRCARLAVT